ncbi:MAG: hypothetical protein V4717_04605 [Bacteroidota bacterium]
MKLDRQSLVSQNQLYAGAHVICLGSFFFPASQLYVGGQQYTQYLVSVYPGQVVLGVLIVLLSIETVYFLKNKKWPLWLGLLTGLYCAAFAIINIWNGFTRFDSEPNNSLVQKLQAGSYPLTGLWMLAIGGSMLLLVSGFKLLAKRPYNTTIRVN